MQGDVRDSGPGRVRRAGGAQGRRVVVRPDGPRRDGGGQVEGLRRSHVLLRAAAVATVAAVACRQEGNT